MKIKILITTLFLGILFLAGCSTKASEVDTFVGLRINPEVGMLVNEDGEVTDVIPLNVDGDVIVADIDVIGMDVEEAAEVIVEEAVEAGYIDVEATDTEVFVDVQGNEESKVRYQERLRLKINQYFTNNGIFGKVSEETLEMYAEEAAELGLPLGQTKMLLLELELNPELSIEELMEMKVKDLVQLSHEKIKAQKGINHEFEEEFKERKEELKEEFANIELIRNQIRDIKITLNKHENYEEFALHINEKIAELEEELAGLQVEYAQETANLELELEAINVMKAEVEVLVTSLENPELTSEEILEIEAQINNKEEEIVDLEEEYNDQLLELEEKQTEIDKLTLEINALETMLLPVELTEEEVIALKEQLAILEEELKVAREEFKDAIDDAKEAMREERKNCEAEAKAKNEQRKSENAARVRELMENFKQNREQTKERVEDFQKGKTR